MRTTSRRLSPTFVVSAELGIVAGIVLAFYLVPRTLSDHTFWTIATIFAVFTNGYLFLPLRKTASSAPTDCEHN